MASEVIFSQPPLIEIVAEFRWDVQALGQPGAPGVLPDTSAHDLQAMNFAAQAGSKGFTLIERLVPPGFPMLAGQVALRVRKPPATKGEPLFQLGPGIFTINITPPYKSWAAFLPFIDLGAELLLASRADDEKDQPFSRIRLRYLDAFGDNLRQGKSISRFLADNLGIHIEFPAAVMQFCTEPEEMKPSVTVSIPIDAGSLTLKISERFVRNARVIVMDTTVTCDGPIEAKKDVLLEKQNAAHAIIHDSFVGMTKPLHDLMGKEKA